MEILIGLAWEITVIEIKFFSFFNSLKTDIDIFGLEKRKEEVLTINFIEK